MHKVTVNQPNLAKGTEVFIKGLGTFRNKYVTAVSDDQVSRFELTHGVALEDATMYGVSVRQDGDAG